MFSHQEEVKNLQDLINAFRKGDIFKLLDAIDLIEKKYGAIPGMSKEDFTADLFISLLSYELSQTDINQQDMEHIVLMSIMMEQANLTKGPEAYAMMMLLSSAPIALAVKEEKSSADVLKEIKLDSKETIKAFLEPSSDFSILLDTCMPNVKHASLPKPEESAGFVEKKLKEMNPELAQTIKKRFFHFLAMDELRNRVSNYYDYLDHKQKNLPNEVSHKRKAQLRSRANAINNLGNYLKDKEFINKNVINKVNSVIKQCEENKPDWSEQSFIRELTDILTLGIKPLIRHHFSKEAEYKKEIQEIKHFAEQQLPEEAPPTDKSSESPK